MKNLEVVQSHQNRIERWFLAQPVLPGEPGNDLLRSKACGAEIPPLETQYLTVHFLGKTDIISAVMNL